MTMDLSTRKDVILNVLENWMGGLVLMEMASQMLNVHRLADMDI